MSRHFATPTEDSPRTPLDRAIADLMAAQAQVAVCAARVQAEAAREREQLTGRMGAAYLTRSEVAAQLGCSPSHVSRLVRSGQIPARWLGSSPRVKRSDLDAYLNSLHGAA